MLLADWWGGGGGVGVFILKGLLLQSSWQGSGVAREKKETPVF